MLNLHKSQYDTRYYVNVAFWLLPLGGAETPKENECHVRSRLAQLVPYELEERVNELFDLDSPMDDATHRDELLTMLRRQLLPLMDSSTTVERLRSGDGQRLIERSLVTGPAQRLARLARADGLRLPR